MNKIYSKLRNTTFMFAEGYIAKKKSTDNIVAVVFKLNLQHDFALLGVYFCNYHFQRYFLDISHDDKWKNLKIISSGFIYGR